MSASFQLDGPDHFTAGAVGAPGQRVFYLQAREAGTLVTLKCEKEQVAALGEYLGGLLARLPGSAAPADEQEARSGGRDEERPNARDGDDGAQAAETNGQAARRRGTAAGARDRSTASSRSSLRRSCPRP